MIRGGSGRTGRPRRLAPQRVLTLVVVLMAAAGLQGQTRAEKGVFRILLHGHPAGTEAYSLRVSADGLSAASTIQYGGAHGRVEQSSTLRLQPNHDLIHYRWTQGKARIDVDWNDGHLNAHYDAGSGHTRDFEFFMPADTVILDDNFYLYWELLADRYDPARGGSQTFRVFVPHTGDPGKITLTEVKTGEPAGMLHLEAVSDAATAEVFLSGSQLQKLEIPSAGVTVEREVTEGAGAASKR